FQMRGGARMGDSPAVDSLIHDGLWCALENCHMGSTAEWVSEKYGISREQQDEYAYHSHMKAVAAIESCQFRREIVPVMAGKQEVAQDERPRADTSIEALGRLKPAFHKDGTVTAGNAPGVNDGAAAVVIASEEKAASMGLTVRARIVGQAFSGVEPLMVMM